MKIQKTICKVCGREISNTNLQKHLNAHNKVNPYKYKLNHEGLECQFCGKVCKNRNSLCNHERLCKENPDRQLTNYEKFGPIKGFNDKGRVSNRKGLTKENDESIRQMCKTRQTHFEQGLFTYSGHPHSQETKDKLRQIAIERNFGGTNRRKTFDYDGITLESSYELLVAQELDKNNIRWNRPQRFYYVDPYGNKHHYTPDFYLPEYDVYLDPKNDYLINYTNPFTGYKDVDKIKWVSEQCNIKVIILDKDNLKWESIFDIIKQV